MAVAEVVGSCQRQDSRDALGYQMKLAEAPSALTSGNADSFFLLIGWLSSTWRAGPLLAYWDVAPDWSPVVHWATFSLLPKSSLRAESSLHKQIWLRDS